MRYNSFSYLFSEGFKNIIKNGKASVSSLVTMICAMILFGVFFSIGENIESAMSQIQMSQGVEVFILDEATDDQVKELGEKIQNVDGVNTVTFKSKQEALDSMKEDLKDFQELLGAYDGEKNIFPASYIVKLTDLEKIDSVQDAIKSMEPKLASLFGYDNALKEFNEYYDAKTRSSSNSHTNIFEGKNLLVIHWESVQNFVVDLKINGEEVTPNLNKLINKSMYFDNFYTQVSVGTSSDTEFTFNTSLMPANYGTAFGNYSDKKYVSIPSMLKDKGYYTFSMHGNNGDFWNRRIMHKNLGYDDLYAKDTYNIDDVIGLGISDVSFFTQSVDKIKKIDSEHENYYGTIITLTNHTPFSDIDKYGDCKIKPPIGKLFLQAKSKAIPVPKEKP